MVDFILLRTSALRHDTLDSIDGELYRGHDEIAVPVSKF